MNDEKQKKKPDFNKIWNIVKKIGSAIAVIFTMLYTIFSLKNKYTEKVIKEVKEDEIKKKDAADIIADSPNQSDIQQSIKNEQDEFRKRVRDRLNQNL